MNPRILKHSLLLCLMLLGPWLPVLEAVAMPVEHCEHGTDSLLVAEAMQQTAQLSGDSSEAATHACCCDTEQVACGSCTTGSCGLSLQTAVLLPNSRGIANLSISPWSWRSSAALASTTVSPQHRPPIV